MAATLVPSHLAADSCGAWEMVTPPAGDLFAVTADGSNLVAVGAGSIIQSPDGGTNWLRRDADTDATFRDVAFGDGIFVAVGTEGTIRSSATGARWSRRVSSTAANLHAIAHGAGRWIAGGDGGTIVTSSDGETWTPSDSGTSETIRSITWGDIAFVAVTQSGSALRSGDGKNWTTVSLASPDSLFLSAVLWDGRQYVAAGIDGPVGWGKALVTATSSDGTTWNLRAHDEIRAVGDVRIAAASGRIVIVGGSYVYAQACGYFAFRGTAFSEDGENWTSTQPGGSLPMFGLASLSDGRFLAVGEQGEMTSSRDGIAWSVAREAVDPQIGRVLAVDDGFTVVGRSLSESSDGNRWIDRGPIRVGSAEYPLSDAVPWQGGLIGVGARSSCCDCSSGSFWILSRAADWQMLASGPDHFHHLVGDGSKLFLLGHDSGYSLRSGFSTDGRTWEFGTLTQHGWGAALTLGATDVFAVVNDWSSPKSRILSTVDGRAWTDRFASDTSGLTGITFGPRGLLAAGYLRGDDGARGARLFESPDGRNWTERGLSPVAALSSIAWTGRRFLAGGWNPESLKSLGGSLILESDDGLDWAISEVPGSSGAATFATVGGIELAASRDAVFRRTCPAQQLDESLDKALILPGVASAVGRNGSAWRSRLTLHAPGAESALARVFFVPRGGDAQVEGTRLEIPAGRSVVIDDVVARLFGECAAAGSLGFVADRRLLAVASTASVGSGFGQGIASPEPDQFIEPGNEGWISDIAVDPSRRTNLGVISLADNPIAVDVAIVEIYGRVLHEFTLELPPFGNRHVGDLAGWLVGKASRVGVRLSSADAGGRFVAWTSTVDSASQAALFAMARRPISQPFIIPAMAPADAENPWTTSLHLRNPGRTNSYCWIESMPSKRNEAAWLAFVDIPPGGIRNFRDVLGELFPRSSASSLLVTPLVGELVAVATSAPAQELIPLLPIDEATGRVATLVGLRHAPGRLQTHLGAVNLAFSPIDLDFTLYDEDGNRLGFETVRLESRQSFSAFDVFRQVAERDIGNGFAVVRSNPAAPFAAWAMVVDPAHDDALFVAAEEAEAEPLELALDQLP